MPIFYKPGSDLCLADWQFHHNHTENKDQEIAGMSTSTYTLSTVVDILVCINRGHQKYEYRCITADATDIHNKRMATEQG